MAKIPKNNSKPQTFFCNFFVAIFIDFVVIRFSGAGVSSNLIPRWYTFLESRGLGELISKRKNLKKSTLLDFGLVNFTI